MGSRSSAATVAANEGNKFHPQVAAAFKSAHPKTIEDVAGIYTKLLAGMDSAATAQLAAYAEATSNDDSKIDAKLASLALVPFKLLPARDLDNKVLREEITKLPLQLQGRGKFDFAKVNELTMTNAGAAAKAMAVADSPNPHDSYVFVRGQAEVHGDIVPRHFLEALSNGKPQPFKEGSGRLELAQADRQQEQPAHRPGDGEPRLDAPLRAGLRPHSGRSRHPQRDAEPSGAARLPGELLHGPGLVAEEAAQAHHALPRLCRRAATPSRRRKTSIRTTAISGARMSAGSISSLSATRCS